MRPPPNVHSNFFSSLKQVEKRLKSEQQSQSLEHNSPLITESLSLSSPIEIHIINQPYEEEKSSAFTESSEPPQAFLSFSPPFPQTHENPLQSNPPKPRKPIAEADDIEQLVQVLGLSGGEAERDDCGSCRCEGGFYSKIAGVKGPKCRKEVERLEGWIKHFSNGGGENEPLRLSLLLLGKAAFVSRGEDCGYGGLDFPSAIDEFLMIDPPT